MISYNTLDEGLAKRQDGAQVAWLPCVRFSPRNPRVYTRGHGPGHPADGTGGSVPDPRETKGPFIHLGHAAGAGLRGRSGRSSWDRRCAIELRQLLILVLVQLVAKRLDLPLEHVTEFGLIVTFETGQEDERRHAAHRTSG